MTQRIWWCSANREELDTNLSERCAHCSEYWLVPVGGLDYEAAALFVMAVATIYSIDPGRIHAVADMEGTPQLEVDGLQYAERVVSAALGEQENTDDR